MLLHLHFQHPSLLPTTLTDHSYSPLPITIRKTFPLPTPKTSIFLVRCSAPDLQILPKSAIQRIAEKLRSLGFTEETPSQVITRKPQPDKNSAGEIFVPLPSQLPKNRVGHTIDTSWSTPENPIPEPGSGTAISRYHELRSELVREEQLVKKREERVPTLAELTLSAEELRRLRTIGIALKKKLKVGKAGITEGIVNGIHERWRRTEVVKIVCEDLFRMNMKRTHDLLERKTGGLVVWRSGSKIILYRGANYKYPYFICDGNLTNEIQPNGLPDEPLDDGETKKMGSSLPGTNDVRAFGPSPIDKTTQPILIQGVGSPNKVRFQLPGEAQLVEEADRLLDGLGPRFTDWWGYDPLPVDADLLPATIPGYRRPFRLLPYGVNPKLTNDEMTTLKRLGRPLPFHFSLGRNRKLQGLAAAIIKLWERCEIAKIAVKRGVQNTNSELMSEELKWLTGGVLLSRDREFIVLYRGKDFLPSAVSSAIEERKRHEKYIVEFAEGDMPRNNELLETKDQKGILHSTPSRMSSHEAVIKRTSVKLLMALEKKAKAEKLLAELEKMEITQPSEVDKEGITQEERYMLRKVGLRMKPFLLLGRRGVFDGTVENIHLHWKYRELVKILVKERNIEAAHQVAKILGEESGGILIAVETVSKGYAIIVYRGKNYVRPTHLRPQTLLNKKEAMKRSLEAQRRESLKLHVLELTKNIDDMKHRLVKDKEMNSMQSVAESGLMDGEEQGTEPDECVKADTETGSGYCFDSAIPSHVENVKTGNVTASNKDECDSNSMILTNSMDTTRNYLLASQKDKLTIQLEGRKDNDNNAEHFLSSDEPEDLLLGQTKHKSEIGVESEIKNGSNMMASRARNLSNKERLLLRKQALKMKKYPLFAIGRSNIVSGVAKAIKAHFKKHPLAIVNVKGRAKGTSMQEVVLKLQEATGGVLVSQEPSKVILYRGWGAGAGPSHRYNDERDRETTSEGKGRPFVSPELIAAIRLECGLDCQEEEATQQAGS